MTGQPVRLRTVDRQEVEFDCDEGQWVLDAAAPGRLHAAVAVQQGLDDEHLILERYLPTGA